MQGLGGHREDLGFCPEGGGGRGGQGLTRMNTWGVLDGGAASRSASLRSGRGGEWERVFAGLRSFPLGACVDPQSRSASSRPAWRRSAPQLAA